MTRFAAVRLNAATLIDLAEHAALHSAAQWSFAVILAGFPDLTRDQALALPLGTRDRLVMQLRAARFGPRLDAQPVCADCGAPFELVLRAEDMGLGQDAPDAAPDLSSREQPTIAATATHARTDVTVLRMTRTG